VARIINTADLLETSALDHNAREWVYNGLDCCVTLEVRDALLPIFDDTSRATYTFSRALQAPILDMTLTGILVDQQQRAKVLAQYRAEIHRLDAQLTRIAREGIGFTNTDTKPPQRWWRSLDKLKNLLYDVMGLPPVRKRSKATGIFAPVVNREALEKLGDYFIAEPIINHLLALRDIDKKRGFLETGIDADGRMRSNFNIAGTNTGRLASSFSDYGTGTNLQNVDRELRSVFTADKGWKFANLDLEQGDARNVGAICWNLFVEEHGETFAGSYLDACESGDLHTYVCRMSRPDLPWTGDVKHDREIAEQIAYRQDSYRQLAKKLGHGTNYYGSPRTMAKHTKVATSVIEEFQYRYFKAFPVIGHWDRKDMEARKLPNWHNHVRNELASTHSLTTLFGRRRQFFGRSFDDATIREAIAYCPQSMTADEIDTGILNLWRSNRVRLLIQVHDSILLQYREEEEDEIIPWALEALQTKLILKKGREFVVPTEAKVGWNWGDWDGERNPEGLIKWKGSDSRKRESRPWLTPKLSILNL
jgi:DNA polymerase I-like protein with 3'-5' exonuclease and polymerase domains